MSVLSRLILVSLFGGIAFCDDHDHSHDDDTHDHGDSDDTHDETTFDEMAGYEEGYHHMHSEGYESLDGDFEINGIPFTHVSGLCNNDDEDDLIYYAISDAVDYSWTNNRSIYVLEFTNTHNNTYLMDWDTIRLEHLSFIDMDNFQTESIAYLVSNNYTDDDTHGTHDMEYSTTMYEMTMEMEATMDSSHSSSHSSHSGHEEQVYFLIASEGDRNVAGRDTYFVLFNEDGSYASTLDYNGDIFGMEADSGFQDNAGPESMTPTPDHQYVLWIASDTLLQDSACADQGCVRMSVNKMDYSTDPPTWEEIAQFRYDKDTETQSNSIGSNTTVTDVTTVDNYFDETLVVEKTEYIDDDGELQYHTKAYHISLAKILFGYEAEDTDDEDHSTHDSHDDDGHDHRRRSRRLLDGHHDDTMEDMIEMYDISGCTSLSESTCDNYNMVIGKNLTSNFDVDLEESIPIASDIHVDSISHGPGNICGGDIYNFVLGVTDSNNGEDTYLLYLCYHPITGDHNHGGDDDDDDDFAVRNNNIGFSMIIASLSALLAMVRL